MHKFALCANISHSRSEQQAASKDNVSSACKVVVCAHIAHLVENYLLGLIMEISDITDLSMVLQVLSKAYFVGWLLVAYLCKYLCQQSWHMYNIGLL